MKTRNTLFPILVFFLATAASAKAPARCRIDLGDLGIDLTPKAKWSLLTGNEFEVVVSAGGKRLYGYRGIAELPLPLKDEPSPILSFTRQLLAAILAAETAPVHAEIREPKPRAALEMLGAEFVDSDRKIDVIREKDRVLVASLPPKTNDGAESDRADLQAVLDRASASRSMIARATSALERCSATGVPEPASERREMGRTLYALSGILLHSSPLGSFRIEPSECFGKRRDPELDLLLSELRAVHAKRRDEAKKIENAGRSCVDPDVIFSGSGSAKSKIQVPTVDSSARPARSSTSIH